MHDREIENLGLFPEYAYIIKYVKCNVESVHKEFGIRGCIEVL